MRALFDHTLVVFALDAHAVIAAERGLRGAFKQHLVAGDGFEHCRWQRRTAALALAHARHDGLEFNRSATGDNDLARGTGNFRADAVAGYPGDFLHCAPR